MDKIKQQDVEALDQADSLKSSAQAFHLPEGVVYLDGNSLGAMPAAVIERMQDVVTREWAEDLIHSWNVNDWFILPGIIGDKIAKLIGAGPGEVIVSDCVSVNLFKLVVAALEMRKNRRKIVTELGNFPTNLYVLKGIARMFGSDIQLVQVERPEVLGAIDEETAAVVLTHTHYKTSEVFDLSSYTSRAHEKGALILWDLCHSAGVMPLELNTVNVDLAVGCGYKYLNGGPGAPAFLYVRKDLQADFRQPISGWWSHADPFAFGDDYVPATDIRQAQSGTQSVLALSALEVGIDIALSVDLDLVREKSKKLGDLFIQLTGEKCPNLEIASPLSGEHRGSHVSIRHEEGYAVTRALSEQGIIVDFRAPDIIRFGFAPLYNSYSDIWNTVSTMADILQSGYWDREDFKMKAAVT